MILIIIQNRYATSIIKIKTIKYIFNIMKNLIRTILLLVAIYSGAVAANSDDVNIMAAVICGAACSTFVIIKDNN